MNKIPVSAVVVTYNEDLFLGECLKSISFCEELIVIDLGSTDKSLEIAEKYATKIIKHERVPVVEMVHTKLWEFIKNQWAILIDPDEVIDKNLAKYIVDNFSKFESSNDIGIIYSGWQFYFKKKKLKGTPWGGVNMRPILFRKGRVTFSPDVHIGKKIVKGYISEDISYSKNRIIHHYWMQSYRQLLKKHQRYLKKEGEAQYNNNARTDIKGILRVFWHSAKQSLLSKRGFKDGFTGVFLSLFWIWYHTKRSIELYKHQKKALKSTSNISTVR